MRGRNRHDPNEPKEFIVEMCARISQGGDRYLYGFGGGKKWLLFLDKRVGDDGAERWRLYTQELAAPTVLERPTTMPSRGPGGGLLIDRGPEPRPEFVSGLPDEIAGRRGWREYPLTAAQAESAAWKN